MQRRIIAAVAAVVLAGIGAVLLYTYVNGAEARAMSTMESIDVLVATKTVPIGTQGANLAPYVELKKLPQVSVVPGALTDTTSVADLVTTSELQPGEQVLPSRFAQPNTTTTGEVQVPTDMQLVSFPLDASKAVGGAISASDRVALFFAGKDQDDKPLTVLALRDVLVVKVQGAAVAAEDEESAGGGGSGSLVFTLALKPRDATRVVHIALNDQLYLALEPKDGGEESIMINGKTVLK